MGKRKTKRKPQKKLKTKLDTVFNCLFCNNESSIDCKMDRANKVGHLTCKVCDVSWQCTATELDEPVDVYSAWTDACEEVNKKEKARQTNKRAYSDSPPPRDHSNERPSSNDKRRRLLVDKT